MKNWKWQVKNVLVREIKWLCLCILTQRKAKIENTQSSEKNIQQLPAGMDTLTRLRPTILPLPSHSRQGCRMMVPVPWHRLQTLRSKNGPVFMFSVPVPRQLGQVDLSVPGSAREPWQCGQLVTILTLISLFTPRAACELEYLGNIELWV